MKGTRRVYLALVLLMVLAAPAFSQITSNGGITGRSSDNSGAVIPGVDVTITSPAMIGGPRTTTTDESGTYQFKFLPPGVYRVSFALPGFKTINIDAVTVTAGATMTINGPMEVSSIAEEVTVTSATPQIDLEQAAVGINWGQKKLDDLPWGRSVVSLAQMVPGIFVTNYDVGGNQMGGSSNIGGRTFGRSGGEVRTYDGVIFCMNFDDFGSYEEVQLTAAAKGAEAMTAGILGTYVVKSGGNTFHGGSQAYWEDGSFQSNNVNAKLLAKGFAPSSNKFTRYNEFNLDLGGPFIHNKFWFYAAYNHDYTGQYVAGFVDQTTNQPAIYPIILNVETLKLTYQLTDKMKLEAMEQQNTKHAPYRNGGPFTPLQATQNQLTIGTVGPQLKWTDIISPKMTTELAITRSGYWWPTKPWTTDPRITDLTTTQTRGAFLKNYTGPVRWQWSGSWSWFTNLAGKSNEIKTGFLGWWDSAHVTNEGYPYQEIFQYRSLPADIAGCTGINCNYFSRPASVVTYDYPNYTKSIVHYNAWYFNDKINLSKKLTLNAGMRYDHYSSFLPAQGNPGIGPFAAGDPFYAQISNFPVYHHLSPRISLSYDVRGNGHLALKASLSQYGAGSSAPNNVPGTIGNAVNQATVITRTYSGTVNGQPCWDGKIPYVPVAACLSSISGGGGTQAISPDLTVPHTTQYTAGIQAGWHKDYLVGFTAVRTFDFGGSNRLNLALPYSAYTLQNCIADPGRNNGVGTYDGGQNPTPGQVCVFTVPRSYPTFSTINNLYVNYADGEGTKNYSAFQWTFQKQQSKGWSMLVGYTTDFARINNPNQYNFSPNGVLYNWELPQRNQAIKMNGTYDVPWHGIKYSSAYQVQSGAWYGRSVNIANANGQTVNVQVEQQAGRLAFVKIWDQRVSKLFKIGDRHSIEGMFDLYNTLNANTILSQITTNGPTFGQPLANGSGSLASAPILPGRIFKLGARWRF